MLRGPDHVVRRGDDVGEVTDDRGHRSGARGRGGSRARDPQEATRTRADGCGTTASYDSRRHGATAGAMGGRSATVRSRATRNFPRCETSLLRSHQRIHRSESSCASPTARRPCAARARRSPPLPSSGRRRGRSSTMEARILLDGHARVGSWMAIEVHLKNDGPAVGGELRLAGGARARPGSGRAWTCRRSRTRRSSCTPSRRRSAASSRSRSSSDGKVVARPRRRSRSTTRPSSSSASSPNDPRTSSAASTCCPTRTRSRRWSSPLTPEDLPERVEAWGALDRLVWQDVDSNRLTPAQLGCAPRLGGRRRAADHRRRDGRPEHAVRVPGRRSCPTDRPPPPTSPRAASPASSASSRRRRRTLPALAGS